MVETVGVEPTSKNISGRLSPSAVVYLISPDERHTADSHQTIPLSPLTLAGGYVRGFLHCRRRDSGLQVNRSRRAGLNYAASAKLLFVLAFLFNGYFLRGSPPRLAYPRSTHLSKPVRPHNRQAESSCRVRYYTTSVRFVKQGKNLFYPDLLDLAADADISVAALYGDDPGVLHFLQNSGGLAQFDGLPL